jgi:hypothetical protein
MKIVTSILLIFLLHGCATFEPKEGMTLREVSQNAYAPCDGHMKYDLDHIKFIKNHPQNPDIKIYNTVARAVYNRGKPECQQDLFFYDSKLISIKTASELIDNYNAFHSFIKQNDLTRLDDYSTLDHNKFIVYRDVTGKLYYSINYKFIEEISVAAPLVTELKRKELLRSEKLKIEKEVFDKVADLQIYIAQNGLVLVDEEPIPNKLGVDISFNIHKGFSNFRVYKDARNTFYYSIDFRFVKESEVIDRVRATRLKLQRLEEGRRQAEQRQEESRRQQELANKVDNILRDQNLNIVYRRDNFIVARRNSAPSVFNDLLFYIKDGVLRKESEVVGEIKIFKESQKK